MGLLEELSAALEEQVQDELVAKTGAEVEAEKDDEELSMYKAFQDTGTVFMVGFAAINPDGDYFVTADDNSHLQIVMKKEDASLWRNAEVEREKRSNLLGINIDVKVKSVDEEGLKVYVEAIKREHVNSKREGVLAQLNQVYNAAQKAGTEMCVPAAGTIIGIYGYYVICNAANSGVLVRIPINNYANYYIRDLKLFAKKGQVIKFNITGKAPMRRISGNTTWEAEHKSYTKDPWQSVQAGRVGKDSVVVAECLDADYSHNKWWAKPVDDSVLPPNMELLGTMKSGENVLRPEVGKIYKCIVLSLNQEKRSLKVIPYQEVLEDRKTFGVTLKTEKK